MGSQRRLLIANRGEIALRIIRTAQESGFHTVAIYPKDDEASLHVRRADEAVRLSGVGPAAYLDIDEITSIAVATNCQMVHPGYGFLSESGSFVRSIEKTGIVFVGPTAEQMELFGNKSAACNYAREKTIPVLGSSATFKSCDEFVKLFENSVPRKPHIIKAVSGGGGRGMRVVHNEEVLISSIEVTKSEAAAAFGSDVVYLEKFLQKPRHVEVQIIADGQGNAIHLGDRDCSLQRRHQKVLEEAPAPDIPEDLRAQVAEACVNACIEIGYRGAGTFEFLYEDGGFYFIEMNTRVQVEHPVTEMITNFDIVKEQLRIAAGMPLSATQEDIKFHGHSFECRINAEDPQNFLPSPGKVTTFHAPGGLGVRCDSHLYDGYTVPPFYDSLIAKVITFGESRDVALARMRQALDELVIEGIRTNTPLHRDLTRDRAFQTGGVSIHYLESKLED